MPPEVVPNGPIAERIGVDDEWIVKRTGIKSRRRALPDERLTDYATFAGRRALGDAGVDAARRRPRARRDDDARTRSRRTPRPSSPTRSAPSNAGAIDVGAACTGWLAALRLAAGQVETGRADRVLVIGAELLTRLTNFDDPKTAMLFGDGAGAVARSAPRAPATSGRSCWPPTARSPTASPPSHDERVLRMDGHSTYQVAVKRLSEATVAAVARAGLELDDIDLFVYHQANGRIIRAVGERLDLEPARVADYVAHMANTSAASIPLTLSLLREDGRLRPGQKVLLAAIGAGFTWGAGVIEWGIA